MDIKLKKLIDSQKAFTQSQINDFYNNRGKFSNFILINLKKRTDRLAKATYTLKKLMISFQLFFAINGNDLDNEWVKRLPSLNKGELGCFLSHMCVLALAASHPEPESFTVIFEDDIISSAGNITDILENIEKLDKKESLDIIYFGKCLENCTKMINIKENIYKGVDPYCTHSYAIKNLFAKKIIDEMYECVISKTKCKNFDKPIDHIYASYINNKVANAIIIHPSIFFQDVLSGNSSDLRNDSLQNYLECRDLQNNKNNKNNKVYIIRIIIVGLLSFISLIIVIKLCTKFF